MTNKTRFYIAFVDMSKPFGIVTRYYLVKKGPGLICDIGVEKLAKRYTRKKDAENAAKWLRAMVHPTWSNGLRFNEKVKQCGVLFKEIVETTEETIL